jgi:hypothetical protein
MARGRAEAEDDDDDDDDAGVERFADNGSGEWGVGSGIPKA